MKPKIRTQFIPRREFLRDGMLITAGLYVSDHMEGMGANIKTNGPVYPVQLGADIGLGNDLSSERVSKLFELLEQWKITYADIHIRPITNAGSQNTILMGERIALIDRYMRQHNISYTLNVEAPNFGVSAEITPGINDYDQPGGLHRWDLRMEWLRPVIPPVVPEPPVFQGIVYDECEHMQLSNNLPAGSVPGQKGKLEFDRPFLLNTHGMDLEIAYDQLVIACRRLREEHYEGRVPLNTEQVWPDMFHIFAHAGWNICPKLLKEGLSSVVMSIALGAAIQYQDRTHLKISPDLWKFESCPGHSIEALRSALLMAYWLGAETIYVESLNYQGTTVRHPDAVTPGTLLYQQDNGEFEVTPYGNVFRDFAQEYVPNKPRPITWRDYRPRIALIRLPDGGWGQSPPDAEWEEYPSRDRLLGNREHPLDKAASEWLYVWPILTHQVAKPGAISLWNKWVYPVKNDFFVPIDSVAVFDHLVEGPVLDSVECFIVSGHALSEKTFKAIKAGVEKGATCIIAKRLYDQYTRELLPGNWLVVTSFLDPRITRILAPFLGPPNMARFRFANHTVEFEKGSSPDQIEVRVNKR